MNEQFDINLIQKITGGEKRYKNLESSLIPSMSIPVPHIPGIPSPPIYSPFFPRMSPQNVTQVPMFPQIPMSVTSPGMPFSKIMNSAMYNGLSVGMATPALFTSPGIVSPALPAVPTKVVFGDGVAQPSVQQFYKPGMAYLRDKSAVKWYISPVPIYRHAFANPVFRVTLMVGDTQIVEYLTREDIDELREGMVKDDGAPKLDTTTPPTTTTTTTTTTPATQPNNAELFKALADAEIALRYANMSQADAENEKTVLGMKSVPETDTRSLIVNNVIARHKNGTIAQYRAELEQAKNSVIERIKNL